MAEWITEIDDKVFSLVKGKSIGVLSTLYPNIFYTTSNEQPSVPKFPTVFITNVSSVEREMDLENDTVNSGIFTYEVQIKVDNADYTSDDCYEVLSEIVKAFKSLRFSVISSSSPNCYEGVWTLYTRFRRTISSNDTL